jgi:hypothetical protein
MGTTSTTHAAFENQNVIAFNEARARAGQAATSINRRTVKPESVGVINDCRDLAVTRICAALGETFDKIEDELFDLAGKSPDRETQNMYLDARNQAREKRKDIEAAFRSQFVSFFEKKVAGEEAPVKSDKRFDLDSLSLVEDDALTENLAVNDIAKRLTDKCDEELRALSQRFGFLLSEPELADEANPIAPDTVVKALKAACDQMTAGFQTKLTVLRMLEQHMAQEMVTVYRDINSHLVAKQIMPTIRPTFRKAQTHISRKPSGATGAGAAEPSALGAEGGGMSAPFASTLTGNGTGGFGAFSTAQAGLPPVNHAVELFHTLQQLMAGGVSFGNAGAATTPIPREYSSVTTGSFAPVPPSAAMFAPGGSTSSAAAQNSEAGVTSDALVSALSRMQQQWLLDHEAMTAMAAVKNFVPGQSAAADLNVLREIKAQGVAQGSNQVDAMTIDIVAMLFDYVFDDKAIPDTIKALIARLQIPVLKVAILDKAFFSRKTHPVRRLLDMLAEASVAFAGEATREDPLYKEIEQIVDRVHTEFGTDITLFETMIGQFENFLKAREAANAEVIEQSARAMHEREKREMARLVAQAEAERLANRADLPSPVAAMVRGPWARVLERVYVRDGGRSARFAEAIETAEQLIWSVQPKADAQQRRDLVSALPLLLKRLQEGLAIATVEKDDRDRFFAVLVDCHAAAVKAGLRGESVAALFAAAHGDDAVAPLFEKLLAEERAREAEAASINRSGMARIQFTDGGVKIEEVVAGKDGGAIAIATRDDEPNAEPSPANKAPDALDFDLADAAPVAPPRELKRGTWVEFLEGSGARVRAKLSWVSPLKGVYLFTNPGASEALSIAPDALAVKLARGSARIIEESSLIDRAVDRMVSSLSSAAG